MKDASTLTNFEDVVLVMSRSAASTTCYNIGIYTLFRVEDGVLRNPVPPADRDTILAWLQKASRKPRPFKAGMNASPCFGVDWVGMVDMMDHPTRERRPRHVSPVLPSLAPHVEHVPVTALLASQ